MVERIDAEPDEMTLLYKEQLLTNFNCNPPATVEVLRQFEKDAGIRLPDDYLVFLQQTNGGEGFIGSNAYIILWRIEELVETNKAYQVAEYAPGLFLFGSDGGGEAFAFDKRTTSDPVVSVPFVGMDLSSVRALAPNFQTFMEQLFRS